MGDSRVTMADEASPAIICTRMPAGGVGGWRGRQGGHQTQTAHKGHLKGNHDGGLDQTALPLFDGAALGLQEAEHDHDGRPGATDAHERGVPQISPGGARLEGFGRAHDGAESRKGTVHNQQEPLGRVCIGVGVVPCSGDEGQIDAEEECGHDGRRVVQAARGVRQDDPSGAVGADRQVRPERRGGQCDGSGDARLGRGQIGRPDRIGAAKEGDGGLDAVWELVGGRRKIKDDRSLHGDCIGREGALQAGGMPQVGSDGPDGRQRVQPATVDPQGTADCGRDVREGDWDLCDGDVVVVDLDDGGGYGDGGGVGDEAKVHQGEPRGREGVQLHGAQFNLSAPRAYSQPPQRLPGARKQCAGSGCPCGKRVDRRCGTGTAADGGTRRARRTWGCGRWSTGGPQRVYRTPTRSASWVRSAPANSVGAAHRPTSTCEAERVFSLANPCSRSAYTTETTTPADADTAAAVSASVRKASNAEMHTATGTRAVVPMAATAYACSHGSQSEMAATHVGLPPAASSCSAIKELYPFPIGTSTERAPVHTSVRAGQ